MDREVPSAKTGGLRDALVAAALDLLEAGHEGVSLRGVARAAGVSAMAPYRHFADKAALLMAVAERGFALLGEALRAADAHPDPREALVAQGVAFVEFTRAHPALFGLMYSPVYRCADSEAGRSTARVLDERVASLAPEHVEAATLACRALVQGLAMLALAGRLGSAERHALPDTLRLLVRGL